MKITLVKKVLPDGSLCKKCVEVAGRLEESGYMDKIDEILVADMRDPTSPGMLLAAELQVDRAPFFVVEYKDGKREVYTIYLKFAKEILERKRPC